MGGAFLFASGVAYFISRIDASDERNVIDWVVFFGAYQNYANLEEVCDTYCIVCVLLWLVMFATGCFVQYKLFKKEENDKKKKMMNMRLILLKKVSLSMYKSIKKRNENILIHRYHILSHREGVKKGDRNSIIMMIMRVISMLAVSMLDRFDKINKTMEIINRYWDHIHRIRHHKLQ